MEKTKLIKYLKAFFKLYLILVCAWFLFAVMIMYSWYFDDGAISDFCIHVPTQSGENYHFKLNGDNACLLDWIPFLQEAIFFPIVTFLILISPACIALFFLRKKK